MIPAAFIQDLLARADIVDVVGRHVQLKKAGINHKGLCPFHGEKSPSFIVSPSRQTYHCFGCGVHGNAIGFLMEHSGLGFIDAVRDLAQQTGMTVPEDDSSPQERERAAALKKRQTTLNEVLAKAGDHYRAQLKASPRAVAYLKGRGLSGEIAARFGLGYAPPGWRGLASVFPRYDDPLLEESGLVIVRDGESAAAGSDAGHAGPAAQAGHGGEPTEGEGRRYDRFRDRIMFPIRSVQGEVIGFGGRVLDRGEPKYLNSPETPVFVKGRELYGLFEARSALRQRGHVLVVEGYMDVVALAQLGIANAVATLGTACTAEHVQKLFRFTDSVVFSFDGDAAGRRAAGRAMEASLPHATDTRSVRFLFLPPEHDPDSYVRAHGAEAFERQVAQAVPLSRQLLDAAAEGCDLDTAEGRARMLANARPAWSALPDGALRRQMLGEFASAGRLEVAELDTLWGAERAARGTGAGGGASAGGGAGGEGGHRGGASFAARRAPRVPVSRGAANLLDRALWLLLHRPELWTRLDGDSHDVLAGQPAPYDQFFGCVERCLLDHGPIGPEAMRSELLAHAERDGSRAVVDRVAGLLEPDPQTDLARELAIVLDRLRLQAVEDELKLLFESGPLSSEAQTHGRALIAAQARYKADLARLSSAQAG